MFRWRRLLTLLPALTTLVVLLTGNVQAALLDFGPVEPVNGTGTPFHQGFPDWFRDTNRVPLQMCVEEVGGCLFAAADRPDLTQPLAYPNLPDELFYYSATALLPNAIDDQLLFAGVEMNLVDNGDGTFDHVGFTRVRIRISTLIAGDYIVTTPWKQYFFHVSQADIDATGDGRRVINATEDIGLRADGDFNGVILGNIGPFGYSQGAPFGTAPNLFLGDGTIRTILGTPNNIFRIEGPAGFPTVETDQFAITGKLFTDPIPTPLTVDKATYARSAAGKVQVSSFATTEALSNQTTPGTFPANFALNGTPSALELTGTGIVPTPLPLITNGPADGKFFGVSSIFNDPGTMPATVSVTNISDIPQTTKVVPLVDEIVISEASYTPATKTLVVKAASGEQLNAPTLQLFFPGDVNPIGTIAAGQASVTFPVTVVGKTYEIPPADVTVTSSIGGSDTKAVNVLDLPVVGPPATGVTMAATLTSPQLVNTPITFIASGQGGDGNYEYRFWINSGTGFSVVQNYSEANTFVWTPAVAGAYDILVDVRTSGSTVVRDAFARINFYQIRNATTPATAVTLVPNVASPQTAGTAITFTAAASGGSGPYEYRFWVNFGAGFLIAQNYSTANTFVWTPTVAGNYDIMVDVRNVGTTVLRDTFTKLFLYAIQPAVATGVSITPNLASPQASGTPVTFTAAGTGGSGKYEYRFWLNSGTGFVLAQNYSTLPTWTWIPSATGAYDILVDVRSQGSSAVRDASNRINLYQIQ